jgi:hypothetical protein
MRARSAPLGVSGGEMLAVGAVVMGAIVVFGGALLALGSTSRFDGLKIRTVVALDPQDRTRLAALVQDARDASARTGASIDRLVDRGVNV